MEEILLVTGAVVVVIDAVGAILFVVIDAVGAVFDALPADAVFAIDTSVVFAIDIAGVATSLLFLYSLSLMFFLLLLV